jgi:hypothetical protein
MKHNGMNDARLIYTAGFIRSATVSLVGVRLAIHLASLPRLLLLDATALADRIVEMRQGRAAEERGGLRRY